MSSIGTSADQVITISGNGFGTWSAFTGDLPCFEIRDVTEAWNGGHIDPAGAPPQAGTGSACSAPQNPAGDGVTVIVSRWTDSLIEVTGFRGYYGQSPNVLSPGDQVEVDVWNAQSGAGPATFRATVAG